MVEIPISFALKFLELKSKWKRNWKLFTFIQFPLITPHLHSIPVLRNLVYDIYPFIEMLFTRKCSTSCFRINIWIYKQINFVQDITRKSLLIFLLTKIKKTQQTDHNHISQRWSVLWELHIFTGENQLWNISVLSFLLHSFLRIS